VVITAPTDNFGGTAAGAVYLFNGQTGALISAIRGSHANDQIGLNGVTLLGNGNFLVVSPQWDNGAAADAGAVTWGSGLTGVSGTVDASNSLIGSQTSDLVGEVAPIILSGGNYVVPIPKWGGAGFLSGAVTWGSGTTGVSGVVSAANSLVGTKSQDRVGESVTALSNGNYVVASWSWDNGSDFNAGAVTWGNGATGVTGAVSPANSLIGGHEHRVGMSVTPLPNGNYVVASPEWDNGVTTQVGAVTWVNGSGPATGTVTAANSLVGNSFMDFVGGGGVVVLSNGNFVVQSPQWGSWEMGATTWGSGTSGVTGVVSSANSLIGSNTNDEVGTVIPLSNGNYLVHSSKWDNGAATDAGAVTWGSGTSGVSGVVGAANSLVGSTSSDQIGSGGIVQLAGGNYVVLSPVWNNGAAIDAGAATWGSATSGVSGVLSSANSLVGTTSNDQIGFSGVTQLGSSAYLVSSPDWNGDAGAVTWANASTGISGNVGSGNSLVGSSSADRIGSGGITILTNGNYVVRSPLWNNGGTADAGAVTWADKTTGRTGVVGVSNSLIGSRTNDQVGSSGVTVLTNGNYVVRSSSWDNNLVTDAGATTWGSGTTGITGVVSGANSVVGSSSGDQVAGVTPLTNGNYVVTATSWDNGAVTNVGAARWVNGATGGTGPISVANSLIGSTSGDQIGTTTVLALPNGNYVVTSPLWDHGAQADAGAATWGDGTVGVVGEVSASNSLVGSTSGDRVGAFSATPLPNGNYLVPSRFWDNGVATDAGAVTWGNGTSGVSGPVSSANSLVGSSASDAVGAAVIRILTNGNYVVSSPNWDRSGVADAGAVTWGSGSTGVTGVISATNSLVGVSSGDNVGGGVNGGTAGGVAPLANGNYVVLSPNFNNGAIVKAGAVTWGSGTAGIVGSVGSANSVLGQRANAGGELRVTLVEANDYFTTQYYTDDRVLVTSLSGAEVPTNTAPTQVILTGVTASLPEQSAASPAVSVATIVISDDGLGTNTVTLTGADAVSFEVVGNTLRLKAGIVLDFETKSTYSVTVVVDDTTVGGTPDCTVNYVLNVTNVNEAPGVALTGATATLPENTATPIDVATIVIADDALGTNTLSLSGADEAAFEIVGNKLRLRSGVSLNFETKSTYSVRVNVNDPAVGGTPDAFVDYSLTLTDVNELPTHVNASGYAWIYENTSTTGLVAVMSIDIFDDALGTNNITLSGPDVGLFQLVGNSVNFLPGGILDFETKPAYTFRINIDDPTLGGPVDHFMDWTIEVRDENEAPTAVTLTGVTAMLPENTTTPVELGTIAITDDALGTNAISLSGADAAAFEVVGNKLRLRSSVALNYETKSSYSVRVNVNDSSVGGNPDAFVDYTLTVTDVNELPTHMNIGGFTLFAENSSTTNLVVVTSIAIFDDALGTNNITLSGPDASFFQLVGNIVRFLPGTVLNFESKSAYSFRINVDDPTLGGPVDSFLDWDLSITDVNEAPTAISLANAVTALPENTVTPVEVATIVVTDDALGVNSFSLSGADAASFEIVGNKLRLRSGVALNFESKSSYSVRVNVDDSAVGGTPDAFVDYTLTVTDVNELPTHINVSGFSAFAENSSTTNLVVVTSIDVFDDALGTNNIFLSGPDASFFQLVGNTVRFLPGTVLDFETKSTYSFRINVDDPTLGASVDFSVDPTVSLTDVNEAPTAVTLTGVTTTLPENTATPVEVATIVVVDDALGVNGLSLSGADAASFEIVGNRLRLRSGVGLNFEGKTSYSVRVNVNDAAVGGAPDAFVDYTLTVSDVNELPTHINVGGFTLFAENSSTTNLVTVTSIDIFDDALGTNSISLTGPDAGSFQVVGNAVRFLPGTVLNFETKSTYSFRVNVDDPTLGAGVDHFVDWTVNLTDVNEAPSAVALTGVTATLPENTSTPIELATISVSDDALGTNSLSLSGSDAAAFEIVGNKLRLKPTIVLDFETKSTYSVRVNADDAAVAASPDAFVDYTLTLTDVNESPPGDDQFDVTLPIDTNGNANLVLENAPVGTPVGITASAFDADPTNNIVTYSLQDDAGGRFTIDSTTGVVTVANASLLNYEAAASHAILVRAVSQDGSSSGQTFTIQLSDVDESDVGEITDSSTAANSVPEHSAVGTPVGITAFASDADGTNSGITYMLWDTRGGRFAIGSATGVVTVANSELLDHATGPLWSIRVIAISQDGSYSFNDFTIAVTGNNPVSPVTDTNAAADTVADNAANGSTVGITAFASDADSTNNTVTYSLTNNAGGRFAIHSTTGVVTVANATMLASASQHTITVQAASSDGSTSTQSFTITVASSDAFDVGEITDTNAAANSVPEHSPVGTVVGITAFAQDLDSSNNQITYMLWDTRGGRFAIDSSTGVVTVANSALLDRNTPLWSIRVIAISQDGSYSFKDYTIAVTSNAFSVGPITDTNAAANVVAENAVNGSTVGITAFASDPDTTNNTVTYSLTNSAGGRFAIDSITGVVTVANASLLASASQHTITVQAASSDGSTSAQSFTIAVASSDAFDVGEITDANAAVNSVPQHSPVGTPVGITAFAQDLDSSNNQITYMLWDTRGGRFAIDAVTGVVTVANSDHLDRSTPLWSIRGIAISQDGSFSFKDFIIQVS
jgi:hypothetical protein